MSTTDLLPLVWFGVIGFGVFMYVLLDGLVLSINADAAQYVGGAFDWLSGFTLLTGCALVAGYALLDGSGPQPSEDVGQYRPASAVSGDGARENQVSPRCWLTRSIQGDPTRAASLRIRQRFRPLA